MRTVLSLILLGLFCSGVAFATRRNDNENSVEEAEEDVRSAVSNEENDAIVDLPGVEALKINFQHYSGYLQVSPTRFLHYWFVTSQGNVDRDPLIFWFNGGPGCSSIEGLLNEMGPYLMNDDGKTLRLNPYAWNKFSSVVYIEAPAGVGYSYASDGNTTTNDDITSAQNYEAVKQFFIKFPSFRNHSTFITGESYGGVYVPTLTARIVDGQKDFKINLKGMAVGNGWVSDKLDIDTSVRFAYGHGLIDEKTWNELELTCCRGCIDGCDLTAVTGHCSTMVEDIFEFMWHGGLNPYDLYRDCEPSPVTSRSKKDKVLERGLLPRFMLARTGPFGNYTSSSFDQPRTRSKSSSKRRSRKRGGGGSLVGTPSVPCMNDTALTMYMNSESVKNALHISAQAPQWEICSDDISVNYGKLYHDMAPFIKKILNANVRILLYYGDTDMACNFMMGQQFSAQLGLKVKRSGRSRDTLPHAPRFKRVINKQPWKFNRQIAGFKTIYSRGLTFITVRGAGHMAPQWRAPEMDYALQQFLVNHPI